MILIALYIMMNNKLYLRRLFLFVLAFIGPILGSLGSYTNRIPLFSIVELVAQQPKTRTFKKFQRNSDSLTYAYFQRIRRNIHEPRFLKQTDTLFNMAQKDNDIRLMCISHCYKWAYCQQNSHMVDSIPYYAKKAMEFAESVGSDVYYFQSWKSLINYMQKYNSDELETLDEIRRMQKVALEKDFRPGVVSSYRALNEFYLVRKIWGHCDRILSEAIEYVEKHPSKDYFNLYLVYISAARIKCKIGDYEEGLRLAKLAEKKCLTASQLLNVYFFRFNYYNDENDYDKAREVLDAAYSIEGVDTLSKTMLKMKNNWRQLELAKKGEWREYIDMINIILEKAPLYERSHRYAELVTAYAHLGLADSVAYAAKQSLALKDSVTRREHNDSYSFYTAQMQLEHYKIEKERLHGKHMVQLAWVLGVALVVLLVLLLWNLNTIRKLKLVNTQLIDTQDELQESKTRAELLNHMKNSFLHSVSHEVRTPLNSIVGFSSLIAEMYEDNLEVKEYVEVICQNSNKLIKLIEDMLLISCLDEEDYQLQMDTFSLMSLCDDAMHYAISNSMNPNVPVVLISDNVTDLEIWTNQAAAYQVLSNLLHNATKFTTQGQVTLSLALTEDKHFLTFEVTDTGCGVPKEQMDQIFLRFRQVDDYSNGFGLGLAICRIVSQRLGGNIWIDKNYHAQGSRFYFKIPVYERAIVSIDN